MYSKTLEKQVEDAMAKLNSEKERTDAILGREFITSYWWYLIMSPSMTIL